MNECQFDYGRDGLAYECSLCHRVARGTPPIHRKCEIQGPPGTGAFLKRSLRWFGITEGSCQCEVHAREMDERGPDWCEANINTIIGWLEEEAGNRGLPFNQCAAWVLVRFSIHKARRAAKQGVK